MSKMPSLPPLPRGFAEEERRKFWRRKQDEDVIARLTAERDAARAACKSIVEWDDAEKNAPAYDSDNGAHFWMRTDLCGMAMDQARAVVASIKQGGAE